MRFASVGSKVNKAKSSLKIFHARQSILRCRPSLMFIRFTIGSTGASSLIVTRSVRKVMHGV